MSDLLPFVVAAAAFLVAAGIVGALWRPGACFVADVKLYYRAYGVFPALVIAGAGGQMEGSKAGSEIEIGLSKETHRQLGLTKESLGIGLIVLGAIGGAIVTIILLPFSGLLIAALVGSCLIGPTYLLAKWILEDSLKQSYIKQARQFPFFLDVFLLTAESGGSLEDAISLYLEVYGRDPLGRELNILAETYRASNEEESFRRLSARVGDEDLQKAIGELCQKISSGGPIADSLRDQREDLRSMREEQANKAAEALNAKFSIVVVILMLSVVFILASLPIAILVGSQIIF